jgi:transposase-like protein
MASALSAPHLQNEEAAYAYVESRVWPEGPICPHCGCTGRIYAIKANTGAKVRIGLKKCGDCRKQFTVKVGTVFESSHVALHLWLQAKKGISSNQLSRVLGVTLKTAWFMSHRIREAMADDGSEPFGSGGGVVEVDETFIGNDPDYPRTAKGLRRPSNMNKVLTMVDRNTGRARSKVINRVSMKEIGPILDEHIFREAHLMTDESKVYAGLGWNFADHSAVNHAADEYARYPVRDGDPVVSTNTVEGTFSIFKRGMRGVYQHCAKKHLHRYMAEFDFRYSNRARLGIDDQARAEIALKGISGKRLTYRTTSARRPDGEERVVW